MADEWRIERANRDHVQGAFDCSKHSLDDFLCALVGQ
jgi:hypothetical protein